jgi:hypothetical protein
LTERPSLEFARREHGVVLDLIILAVNLPGRA